MVRYITNGKDGVGPQIKRSVEECIRLNKRYCTRCGEDKDFSAFGKSANNVFGLNCVCKICTHVPRTELKRKPNGKGKPKVSARTIERAELKKRELSRCSSCKEIKPFKDFFPSPKNSPVHKWPVSSRCRKCDKEARTERKMKMTPDELKSYRKKNYNSVLRFAKNNPEKSKAMLKNQHKKARAENRPGYIRTFLYSKLGEFKDLKNDARKGGFTPSAELMEAGKSLNILSLKMDNYGKSVN